MTKFEYKFEGSKLKLSAAADTNKDGEPVAVMNLEIDLAEIPDEVFAAIKSKKESK
jgi:heat shock protein HslJ